MDIFELISRKDIFILTIGGAIGYLVNMIVVKQTVKNKGLTLETTGRRIIVESATSCPFMIEDLDGNRLDNVYLINIRLWNKGKLHVKREDISINHPLEINFSEETKVLGEPIVFRGSDKIGINIHKKNVNIYGIDFECANPGEWSELGFFVKDNPNVSISATGRIHGQDSDFNISIDDGKVSFFERLIIIISLLTIILSPFALILGLGWLFYSYSIPALINDQNSIPESLKFLLLYGCTAPFLFFMNYGHNWLKKRGNPKSYPIDEDFHPNEANNIGALWGTALHGKNYRISDSSKNKGKILVLNDNSFDE